MSTRSLFADMRRSGFGAGLGLSKGKLAQAMYEILVQLPEGTANLKDVVVANLGTLGQMSATRDVNEAWNQAKRKAAKEHPDKFMLDGRKVLHWNDGAVEVLDKKISTPNFRKLNDLANKEGCSVNAMVSKLIRSYAKRK